MNFNKWINTLDLANLNDLQPNEGMEMGWFACKNEVLKILSKYKTNISNYPEEEDSDGYDFDVISLDVIKEIEKL